MISYKQTWNLIHRTPVVLSVISMIWVLFIFFCTTLVKGSTMPLAASESKVVSNPQYPEIKPRTPPQEPRAYLYWYGQIQGLEQWEIKRLDAIIDCESTWRPWVSNGQYKGLFQIGTWEYKHYGIGDLFNAFDNIRSGIAYYKVTGFHVWSCYK
mgnify:FL=1